MTRIAFSLTAGVLVVLFAFAWIMVLTVPSHAASCGSASYYAEAHQGKLMANGRPFNMNALTAASWFYPLGTKVRVTAGGKSVVVTVTDRGPAHRLVRRGRILDLSKAAFAQLAPLRRGIIQGVCVSRP